jgi:hypothetical protein
MPKSLHKHIATGEPLSTFDGANHDWGTTPENSHKGEENKAEDKKEKNETEK